MNRRQYDLRKIKGRRLNFDEESDRSDFPFIMPDSNPDLTAQVRDLQQQLEALRTNAPSNRDETTRTHTRATVQVCAVDIRFHRFPQL